MYNVGTVTTTANSTKLIGVGTKWKENINLVLPMQMMQIQIGNTVHNNSIHSIQSNTELTLNFPIPTAQTGAKYVIFTTTMDSISAAANAIVAMNVSNVQFSDIQNRIMTESGVIDVKLPDGTVRKTRTEAERDKLLDGKFDKAGGTISGAVIVDGYLTGSKGRVSSVFGDTLIQLKTDSPSGVPTILCSTDNKSFPSHELQMKSGTLMHVGDHGWGNTGGSTEGEVTFQTPDEAGLRAYIRDIKTVTSVFRSKKFSSSLNYMFSAIAYFKTGNVYTAITANHAGQGVKIIGGYDLSDVIYNVWTDRNATKDSNGNLKAASPIVKLFADHIETNDESEGVEMEHLGIGHYLIKGVVGFNADGAWGIDNGFVIPQDHNGKNMVLIDYEVKPDGDIELFVFHQQNADLPERFQNKRIKHIDEDGNPVYYENYEPCDVPESRWIDMRVEMPVNSIYNLKQAEAERLAKEEADKQAEEEAKNAEIEAE
ncbi:cell envelope integrity protein TolA [Providencia vermicola]|uniref:cell envelope integrity protein TolA n=1 Tax=Providencia vermicola TaxID=333965 RepID=UPI0034E45060